MTQSPESVQIQQNCNQTMHNRVANNLKRHRKRYGRGMSLLGLLLTLTIVGTVLAFSMYLFFTLREDAKMQQAIVNLNALVAGIDNVYPNKNYGSDENLIPVLDRYGVIPEIPSSGTGNDLTLQHEFGGNISITGGIDGNSNRYGISYEGLDDHICARFAGLYATASRSRSGIDAIQINGSELETPTPTAITAGCDQGDESNSVSWIFY